MQQHGYIHGPTEKTKGFWNSISLKSKEKNLFLEQ
jgi:hypothetical protein